MKVSILTPMSSSQLIPQELAARARAEEPRFHIELKALVDAYLARTPAAGEAHLLMGDLRKLHPLLLADTLRELIAGRVKGDIGARPAMLKVYGRKTKEMAALYPLAFSVENALRARLAEAAYDRFGYDTWWKPIRHAMVKGDEPQSVKAIVKVPITSGFARRVAHIVKEVDGEDLKRDATDRMKCGSTFLSASTFGQLRYLVIDSWTAFGHLFDGKSNGLRGLTKDDFASLTKTVNETRNELYHHNPVAHRQRFVEACERIADHLDLHLGSFDAFLKGVRYARPEFDVAVRDRHCTDYPDADAGEGDRAAAG